ncbi:MAG TPA: hypothetical protein VMR95_00845 [Candidatus Binatia bacterium]|nr:hypothetical protein [Candidatus Binatia bacterium]
MAFMKILAGLFDEDSTMSLDKVLDGVEQAIGNAVDKVEEGVKQLEEIPEKALKMGESASTAINKLEKTNKEPVEDAK